MTDLLSLRDPDGELICRPPSEEMLELARRVVARQGTHTEEEIMRGSLAFLLYGPDDAPVDTDTPDEPIVYDPTFDDSQG